MPEAEAPEQELADNAPPEKRRRFARFQLVAVVIGLTIFGIVIYEAGYATILEALGKVGWVFLIVVALNGVRHLLRSGCLALIAGQHGLNYRDAVVARLGGEAAGMVSFTGALVSETTKAALLRSSLSTASSISTILLDNLIYIMTVGLMVFAGAALLLATSGLGDAALTYVIAGIAAVMVLGFVTMTLSLRLGIKPLTFLLARFSDTGWMPRFVSRRSAGIHEVERAVFDFYGHRRADFFKAFAINLIAHSLSVAEVYLILRSMGAESGLQTAFVIESLTKVVTFTFSLIPGNLGIYEGGASILFRVLGYSAAIGVALALVRRGSILVWTAVGLLLVLIARRRAV